MKDLFTIELFWGILLGTVFAIGDALLLRVIVRKSGKSANQDWFVRGMIARMLLTVAVVTIGFLLPFVNVVGVVIALLIQKFVVMIVSFIRLGKR